VKRFLRLLRQVVVSDSRRVACSGQADCVDGGVTTSLLPLELPPPQALSSSVAVFKAAGKNPFFIAPSLRIIETGFRPDRFFRHGET
jgi:hypothetical protein